jgi:DNA-binding MarR family transcriptional regulator
MMDRSELLARLSDVWPDVLRRVRVAKSPEIAEEMASGLGSVTVHQVEALWALEQGALSMSQLAKALHVSESAATALVDRLVRHGLVERRPDPADRRVVRIELSERARSLADQVARARLRTFSEVFSGISDEKLGVLVAILEEVVLERPEEGAMCSSASRKEHETAT